MGANPSGKKNASARSSAAAGKTGPAEKAKPQENPHQKKMRELLRSDLSFYESADLQALSCAACEADSPLISAYPYSSSALFANLLTCWCRHCGFGWVPALPFSLSEYYSKNYAKENRKDRDLPPKTYFAMMSGPESKMTVPKMVPYTRRAKAQLRELKRHVPKILSLLEFGSGPGYGLYFSDAVEKHAIEPDKASAKYLDEIGVKRVTLKSAPRSHYDAVLASHSLEHLPIEELFPTLLRFRELLKPKGVLYIEVPNGAHTLSFLPGNHSPHTLFFSQRSLRHIVARAGFEILLSSNRVTKKGQTPKASIHSAEHLEQPIDAQGITVVARKSKLRARPAAPEIPTVRPMRPKKG